MNLQLLPPVVLMAFVVAFVGSNLVRRHSRQPFNIGSRISSRISSRNGSGSGSGGGYYYSSSRAASASAASTVSSSSPLTSSSSSSSEEEIMSTTDSIGEKNPFCYYDSTGTGSRGLLGSNRSCFISPTTGSKTTTTTIQSNEDLHLIILVHGWMGNPDEMISLKERLEARHLSTTTTTTSSTSTTTTTTTRSNNNNNNIIRNLIPSFSLLPKEGKRKKQRKKKKEHVWIHSATCNDGNTFDGIIAGGNRLANEINEILIDIWDNIPSRTVRLSLVGNSLGGLYARYALSQILWDPSSYNNNKSTNNDGNDDDDDDNNNKKTKKLNIFKNKKRTKRKKEEEKKTLVPNLFVTTATPHLGCGFQQTYLPLPRSVEFPIAHFLKQTGKDLFRFSSVIDDMTLKEEFTYPLSTFQQRIAYINVHGTDFQVPTPTAAFWADTDSEHHVVPIDDDYDDNDDNDDSDDLVSSSSTSLSCNEGGEDYDNYEQARGGLPEEEAGGRVAGQCDKSNRHIVMKLTTPSSHQMRKRNSEQSEGIPSTSSSLSSSSSKNHDGSNAPFSLLSLKLDQLGWTKVLVDVRDEIPLKLKKQQQQQDDDDSSSSSSSSSSNQHNQGEEKSVWTSRELLEEFDTGRLHSFPIGHTILVANAKSDFYREINKGGLPIMDHLAKEIINST